MAFAFDSLGYPRHLRDAGVPQDQAEAHAEAARQFMMAELVTRYDLDVLRRELETKIDAVRRDLETKIDAVRRDLETKIDTLSLRLTVRMGVMLAAGVAVLAAIIKL
jgi:hypothetical protein